MNNRLKFRAWITPWGNSESYMQYIEDLHLHIYFGNWERGGYKEAIFQQYTGLTDSNETEIYEGDILKISYGAMGDVIGQVLYEADHGGYIFQWERKGPNQNYINLNCDVAFESVIVGNVNENSELLK